MTTYDLSNPIGKARLAAGDTDTANAIYTDAEWQVWIDRWEHVKAANRVDWAAAEALEALLVNDGRLVGCTTALGVSLDGVSWRDALKDRVRTLRQRHYIAGPNSAEDTRKQPSHDYSTLFLPL